MAQGKRGIAGILLAAGRGTRFDPAGVQDKLMQSLPGGMPVAVASAHALCAVLPNVLAVVRPDAPRLAAALREADCEVSLCAESGQGMGASLVHALRRREAADGWIIALADMPFIQSSTLQALQAALVAGADIAVPVREGRRGNPVAFSRRHLPELLSLGGDEGARRLLRAHPVTEVAVDDPGIHRDIDQPGDLPIQP
ncbi:molybdenum cofactor cytidylyltransferase [Noviherbaspirillum humi]|uniref:Molybdenum cofactor cytidylyltransferase n=1 Tax=Noviherbaspirillum humi TaxID=1688639 RepID=A0A239LSH8_9BURK|nr:nucleotidyltransferase family protein [Noviherbaspirillum humi]SNT32594.1 molybdenum cofactor cytidylyltransferase [Noviherbaspirillum humi]